MRDEWMPDQRHQVEHKGTASLQCRQVTSWADVPRSERSGSQAGEKQEVVPCTLLGPDDSAECRVWLESNWNIRVRTALAWSEMHPALCKGAGSTLFGALHIRASSSVLSSPKLAGPDLFSQMLLPY